MILSASRLSPNSVRNRLVDWVARIPARVRTKLLAGFLSIVGLLIVLGAVGLNVLGGVNERTEELITLQRKIAAYRQVQHDTTNQLYGVSTALLFSDQRMLDSALRQLNQFGYDLDRMEFVAASEKELLGKVREDFNRLTAIVTRVAELIRAGRKAEAGDLQRAECAPVADRLERLTNQLVNLAEADMVAAIEATERTYRASRLAVIGFALGSILLALGLGYVISSALIEPVTSIGGRLRRIAAGDFEGRVEVANRDELGALAKDVNHTSEELGRLYREIETRNRELTEALEQQIATSAILRVIAASPTDIQPVLSAVAESAAKLCEAYDCIILLKDGESLAVKAHFGSIPIDFSKFPVERGWVSGRAFLDRKPVHLHDATEDTGEFPDGRAMAARLGYRTILAVPLLREGEAIGVLRIVRIEARPFGPKRIELLTTFADQAMIAIENVRLFEEVQTRTRELQASLEYQTATSDLLSVISRSPTQLQPVLDAIVETAARLCGADKANIRQRQGDSYAAVAACGFTTEQGEYLRLNPVVAGPGSVVGRVALSRGTVHIPDIHAEPEFTQFDLAKAAGFESLLSVPLLREDELMGVLVLTHDDACPFTDEQIERAESFADQAVIAIENARLFEEVQARTRELQESLDYQTATSEILNVISRSPTDLRPVMDVVAENAARVCAASDALIFRIDGGVLRLSASFGHLRITESVHIEGVAVGRGTVAGRAVVDRRTIHVADLAAELESEFLDAKPYQHGIGHRTTLATPLLREGVPLGAIVIRRMEVKPFSERQIALLETFADQAVIAIENVRLFEEVQARTRELQESLEYQTATSDVLGVISRSPSELQPVLDAIARTARRLCQADRALIWRLEDGKYRMAARDGALAQEFEKLLGENPAMRGRGSLVGRVALERDAVHIDDIQADAEYTVLKGVPNDPRRTMLGVPLLRDGAVIGVIVLSRSEVRPFTERQIDLVTTFADQAVIAINNVGLFDEVQARTGELARSVGELKALGEVSQAVNSTLDLKTVLETIVAKAVQLSETDAGAIYVYSKSADRFRLRATYGMSEELIAAIAGQTIGLHDAGIGEAARLRAPVQVADLKLESKSPVQQIVLDAGYRGVLVVPLLRLNKIVGALVVRRKTPGLFEDSTVHLLETFAAQSVLAIQNARLFSEIEEKGHQLEIASRHKSQFLANMSHELRTPLNSVLGFSEMLADGLYGELPEKAKATLARIQANGKHLLGLINDVLDLAKIEAGQLELVIDDYSAGQIVKSAAAATEPLARAKRLELKAVIAKGMPLGRGDERRLIQVLLNLAGNAVKFTDTGSVEIVAKARNGSFEFTVRDTGPGIAPEFQARIFEEFQQVDDSSTRKKGGTGLGLAISKRIVEMHGGTIGVKSAPGAGSEFKVTIPVRADERIKTA